MDPKQEAYWLNKDSRLFLSRGYLRENQTAEERIKEICDAAESILGLPGFSDKFENYVLKGWISFSSPVWANFGTPRALPISCFNSYVYDSVDEILRKSAEVGMMTKHGGGTSGYFGEIRPRGSDISDGGKTDGAVHFMEAFQTTVNIISQSSVRRGSFAAYLPIEHQDIKEFLNARDEGHPIQTLSIGVTITDAWMEAMIAGDKDKRKLWGRIIKKRFETGYPYLIFVDNVNNFKPQWYKDLGYNIYNSNLCTEVFLPSSMHESFVCDLSSVNLLHYDEWKDTDLLRHMVYFLDAVMTEFINKAKNIAFMEDAVRFAERHRAIGVGVLGWHSLLQSKMIPFASDESRKLNIEIFELMEFETKEASKELATLFGEPEVLKGYGHRNTTTMAIAPTTSSSFILGQISPAIEPLNSNYFVNDLAKGKFTYKNPYLKELLKSKGLDTKEVWHDILLHGGSVQFMTQLTQHEKDVFKTFGEIPQIEIITQAAIRQQFIDQGQSLNLTIHPSASPKDVSDLLIEGWKLGIKSFYYQRGTNVAQEFVRDLLQCQSCQS